MMKWTKQDTEEVVKGVLVGSAVAVFVGLVEAAIDYLRNRKNDEPKPEDE